MKRICPVCGARESDELLVACPNCGASYDDESLIISRPELDALEIRVLKKLTRKVSRFVFGGFSVMTVVAVATLLFQFRSLWWAGVQRLQKTLNDRIAEEFQTKRIRDTVSDVADKEAKVLLRESLQPQIDNAVAETKSAVQSFSKFLDTLRKQNQSSFDALNSELVTIKDRDRLMQLSDDAVNAGDRPALEELERIATSPNNAMNGLARSLMLQVKNFYQP